MNMVFTKWSSNCFKYYLCGKFVTSSFVSLLSTINGSAACDSSIYHQILDISVKTDLLLHAIKFN